MRKPTISGNSRYEDRLSEQRLLRVLPAELRKTLPMNWLVEVEQNPIVPETARGVIRPDALMTIRAPDGNEAVVIIEAKSQLSPRDVPAVTSQLRRYQDVFEEASGLVVASFLPARTQELLTEASLSYADATGNVRLILDRPAVFINTVGESSDPWGRGEVRSSGR